MSQAAARQVQEATVADRGLLMEPEDRTTAEPNRKPFFLQAAMTHSGFLT